MTTTVTPNTTAAQQAIDLVGKLIRPAYGSERWAFANGRAQCGRVVDVHIPDLGHPYIVCQFGQVIDYLYPHDVEALPN